MNVDQKKGKLMIDCLNAIRGLLLLVAIVKEASEIKSPTNTPMR